MTDAKEMPSNQQVRMQVYGDQEILTLNSHVSFRGNLKLKTDGILKKARPVRTVHPRSQLQFSATMDSLQDSSGK